MPSDSVNDNPVPQFPVHCPDALEKYNGRYALFCAQYDRKYFELTGRFIVRQTAKYLSIDLEFWGPPLAPASFRNTEGVCIHLTQEHVGSIIALPQTDPVPAQVPCPEKPQFRIQVPFLDRH